MSIHNGIDKIQILALKTILLIFPNHFLRHPHPTLYSQLYFIIILFHYLFLIISFKASKHTTQ